MDSTPVAGCSVGSCSGHHDVRRLSFVRRPQAHGPMHRKPGQVLLGSRLGDGYGPDRCHTGSAAPYAGYAEDAPVVPEALRILHRVGGRAADHPAMVLSLALVATAAGRNFGS